MVVEFGSTVDEAVNDTVMAFDSAVSAAGIDGVIETVPTYRSLQVVYDPLTIRATQLIPRLRELGSTARTGLAAGGGNGRSRCATAAISARIWSGWPVPAT